MYVIKLNYTALDYVICMGLLEGGWVGVNDYHKSHFFIITVDRFVGGFVGLASTLD